MGKKLLMITHNYPLNHGDTAFISTEIEYLCEKFDHVILFCTSVDDGTAVKVPNNCKVYFLNRSGRFSRFIKATCSRYFEEGILYLAEEIQDIRGRKKDYYLFSDMIHFFLRALTYCLEINNIINIEGKPDVVYSFWSDAEVLASIITNKNIPVCARIHGYDLYEERRKSLYQPFKKVIDRRINTVFFISNQGMEYYKSKFATGMNARYVLSYLGTISNRKSYNININRKPFKILSASAVIPIKRVHLIVESLALVDDEIEIEWTHIGDGEDLEKIKCLVKEKLSNKANVSEKFLGFLEHEKLLRYIEENEFHLLINSSSTEGIPVSMMEAMSNSIPIVGTDVGGVKEIVDRSNGFLLPVDATPKEFADIIEYVANMPNDEYGMFRQKAFEKWNSQFNGKKNYDSFSQYLAGMKNIK